jgi:outer membrane lipoprotein-sorting protein
MSEPALRRRVLLAALALPAARARAQVATAAEAQRILGASDAIRNPAQPFVVELELVEYRQGTANETTRLVVHAKARAGSGQFRSIVRFVAPARDRNKLMLRDGNDLWFYDPHTQASVRVARCAA